MANPPEPYPQRNVTGDSVDVPAIPATVQPAETVSWPVPLAGFERVTPEPDPAPAPEPPAPTKTRRDRTDTEKGAAQ
ncbi:hypothetical protein ACIQGZ_16960 [Streptomyces sp. NPDC092296]|uniref:hypothetical protein n=1 Tax=Streptomyces sp. NPDC092296 TaxID=3366012 RepID=UPI00381B4A70